MPSEETRSNFDAGIEPTPGATASSSSSAVSSNLLGKPAVAPKSGLETGSSDQGSSAARVFVLDWPREQLYARIDARVQAMFAAGLVDEVRELLAAGHTLGRTARQALGYREVLEHLAGQRDLRATIELVARRTRNFAKRQLTWFRGLSECRWIGVDESLDVPAVLTEIVRAT
ncbi:MAG: hypothetical protein K2Y37_07570 [Pirellulales bacterium]|nr:hypothetical protein [Pirellulales bacterium]